MKNVIISLCLVFCCFSAHTNLYAQIKGEGKLKTNDNILFIINQKNSNNKIVTFNLAMNMKHATAMNVINKNNLKSEYIDMGAVMAFEITLEPSVKLINMNALLNERKVSAEKKKYPVYFGDTPVNNKTDVWINKKDLKELIIENSKIIITLKK